MLFPEEDSPVLKDWIVKRLENTSDADADVLADYVLALLHNASDGDIQAVFEEEITPFLKEDTKGFAEDLIQTIKYKSYLPGANPPPKAPISATAATGTTPNNPPFFGNSSPNQQLPTFPTGPSSGNSRKRGFQDRGDFDAPNGRDQSQGGGRPFKQPRRGGRNKGYLDLDRPRPTPQLQYGGGYTPNAAAPPFVPSGSGAPMPPFDPNNPMEAMRQLQQLSQQLGMQMAALTDYSQRQGGFQPHRLPNTQKHKGRCRDYDTKGYCARGQNCMFEHSNDSEQGFSLPAPHNSGQIQLPTEEYDPNAPTIMAGSPMGAFPPPQANRTNNHHGNGGRDNSKGSQHRKKGGPRASFSASGPVHDKSQTKVVVESIPEENFEEEQVRGFFSQFGNIANVTMMPYKRLAVVEYDNWGSANAAYRSPKVIFDNRFVKVFWYKEEKHGEFANGKPGSNGARGGGSTANGLGGQSGEFEIEDMEEFTRRQEEAQKAHEEKMRKKEEIEKQRAELEKRQKELQAKQLAEKQRLLAKLGGSQKASGQDTEFAGTEEKPGDAPKSSTTQTEALRATLAKLQEEAKAFGLDPNAPPDEDATISTYSPFGARGGRGGYSRARGYPARGAYRGRGGRGNIHAAYAAFSLDNRPKKVSISGVDFSAPEKDEALRQHLFSLGEFAAEIQVTPSETHISFNDRKAAEKFYNSVQDNKSLLGVTDGEGEVELSWVANTAGPLPGSSTSKVDTISSPAAAAYGNGGVDDGPLDSVMMDTNSTANQNQNGGGQQEAGEVDYDVGGENEWDIA